MLDDSDPKTVHWRARPDPNGAGGVPSGDHRCRRVRPGMAIKLQRGRHSVHHLREEPDGRRHLAGELLSRLRRGYAQPFLLAVVRAEPRLAGSFLEARRAVELHGAAGGPATTSAGTSASRPRSPRPRYDEARASWRITTRDAAGTKRRVEANAVITAVGQLNRPVDSGHSRAGRIRAARRSIPRAGIIRST